MLLSEGLPRGRLAPRPVLFIAALERALGPFASRLGKDVLALNDFFVVFSGCVEGGLVGVGVFLEAVEFSSGTGVLLSGLGGSVGDITILGSFSSLVMSVMFGSR